MNQKLDQSILKYRARDREHVEHYLSQVLMATPLPPGFPRRHDTAFNPIDEHIVVRFELPPTAVVPEKQSFTYVRTRDEITSKARAERQCASMYRSVISQVSLLAIRDIFAGDHGLRKVTFSGHVSSTDPATGKQGYPCFISVVVDRPEFSDLILDRVSAEECLRHLRALVSAHPYAVQPVKPIVDFDRTRYAFVEGVDVIADLDYRDNLMDLTPTQFEHLVRQLFEGTPGMQGWTTQSSNDGGVDAVIFNNTPITGGLTVVQAKQYSKSLGVQHVRELAGAMVDKKAGRGVLVTTSGCTKGAREFSDRHGQIQLIEGSELVYLLKETLGKEVVIGPRRKT